MDEFTIELIKNKMKLKRTTPQALCEGICSNFVLSQYLTLKQLPDVLTFDALLQRLGIAPNTFRILLSAKEYSFLQQKMQILLDIHQSDWNSVQDNINSLKIIKTLNITLQEQFSLIIRGILFQEIRNNSNEAISCFMKAFSLTHADFRFDYSSKTFDYSFDLMTNQEWCAILNALNLLRHQQPDFTTLVLQNIIYQLEYTPLDEQEKATIYSYAIYMLATCYFDKKQYTICHELCQRGISFLCKNWVLSNLTNLMECDIECKKHMNKTSEVTKELQQLDALRHILHNSPVNSKWLITPMIEIGQEFQIYGTMIAKKRKEMECSQKVLCSEVCDLKTLQRIETGKISARKSTLELLFKKLNISISYFNGEVVITDIYAYELYRTLKKLSASYDIQKLEGYLNDLKKRVDSSILINRQWIYFFEGVLNFRKGILTKYSYRSYMEAIIKQQFPTFSISEISTYSLNNVEVLLFLQLARGYEYENDYDHAIEILEQLLIYYQNQYILPEFQYRNLGPIKMNLATYYMQNKDFSRSLKLITDILQDQLLCNQTLFISHAVMGKAYILKELGYMPEAKKYYGIASLLGELFHFDCIAIESKDWYDTL